MAAIEIHQFSILNDNYAVLIHDPATGATASIDAAESYPIERELEAKGWKLTDILVTHHHADHTEGIAELKDSTGCRVVGPRREAAKIPRIDLEVGEGESFKVGSIDVHVIETPGHTLGHVAYIVPAANAAFVGDTLFSLGCGRMFEGTPQGFHDALRKLAALPGETQVYCGHEYTVSNGRFALTVDPDNAALQRRMQEAEALRAKGFPTLPTTITAELATNPFLRAHVPAIQQRLGMEGAPAWQVFGELRDRKNRS
ncbi:MAG: hydroxyacylglutathione hydrolase [Hyphomicrobiaceae bacterium]|nr:hydroxyacylglutathione hydrolase [Hyphomicrobiaceae bacterium]